MKKFHPVQIVLGSDSDQASVDKSKMLETLTQLDVLWQISYISAHRHPEFLANFCKEAIQGHVKLFIAVAGMMPALPGSIAGLTDGIIPVIGVPLDSSTIPAKDTVTTTAAMPPGTPIIIPGYSITGLKNAAIVATQILAVDDEHIKENLRQYRQDTNPTPQIHVQLKIHES